MDRQGVIGQSEAFLDAMERAGRAATLDRPVLVIGERGTGKELVAQRLHHLSQRWGRPLVTMNCAALPETLIEAELFGHEAGAFTGAVRARAGRFEDADGGTLFLDELGTLSMAAQERLLRVIEYGEVTRIGASRPASVDVRIVAATNENLPDAVSRGRFRADLLDRLSFEVITLPPLRARDGDVALLADHFGRRMASELGWERWPNFTPELLATMEAYDWPGNVRELRNTVERAVYRWDDDRTPIAEMALDPFVSPWAPKASRVVEPDKVPSPASGPNAAVPVDDFRRAVAAYERSLLEAALVRYRHNQRAAARALNLSYDQFRHCLRRHGLLGAEKERAPAA